MRARSATPTRTSAIEDALRVFPADEIVISTHPPRALALARARRRRAAREEIDLPITHVVVDLAAERASGRAARDDS